MTELRVEDGGASDGGPSTPAAEPTKFCPFQSFSFLAPAPGKPLTIHGVPKPADMQIRTLQSPCMKEKCMLWGAHGCNLAVPPMMMVGGPQVSRTETIPGQQTGATNETP